MAVPDATQLPSTARPMRASKAAMRSLGNPSGKVGNGTSSTRPISSQCPVTESLPADRSAIRPQAAAGTAGTATPRMGAAAPRPRAVKCGIASGTWRAMLPRVSLPTSP